MRGACAAFQKKDYERAIELYKGTLGEPRDHTTSLAIIAYCYKELNHLDDAMEYCNEVLQVDSDNFFALEVLAEVYARKNEDEQAYQCIQRALSNRPAIPDPPKGLVKFTSVLFKLFGQSNHEKSLKDQWYEPEDQEWLDWAQKFKQAYEAKHGIKGDA